MTQNIVICLDGTWNDKDDQRTLSNVALLHEMALNEGVRQIAYYDPGVGTDGWYDKKLGGLHGVGLSKNIRQAYTFLARNYSEGDQILIFGFSRGAYTARSLTGLLFHCALPSDGDDLSNQVKQIYTAYKETDLSKMAAYKSSNRKCPVEMLGVWDTVGALGIPASFLKSGSDEFFSFHDMALSPEVRLACHAVAIDEKRASFEPTLWEETAENRPRIKQVWFPGVHSDVGGGYPERHHSDAALEWMVNQAQAQGLLLDPTKPYEYKIDLNQDIHDSAYEILGIEIGDEPRVAKVTDQHSPKVHRSVREKMRLRADYVPLALSGHLGDRETLAPYEIDL